MVEKHDLPRVKDKLWIWGNEFAEHNKEWGIKGLSQMTPAEGAFYLGVPNILLGRAYGKPAPPFEQYVVRLSPLKRIVWSIVGSAGETESNEIDLAYSLAARFPNICGLMMDDFFHLPPSPVDENGKIAVFTPMEIKAIKEESITSGRKLDLWVVLYDEQLDLPVGEHLKQCDVISLFRWNAKEIDNLERNFERLEKLSPLSRKVLGCYMYDWGNKKLMPISLMEKQCQLGLRWLQEKRIEGMLFCSSSICDLGLETVEWTRKWIQKVGEKKLNE